MELTSVASDSVGIFSGSPNTCRMSSSLYTSAKLCAPSKAATMVRGSGGPIGSLARRSRIWPNSRRLRFCLARVRGVPLGRGGM